MTDAGSAPIEVLVIGGGPAGMSAALVLARSRRQVLVVDAGRPRNAATAAVHGFLTRDGIAPEELRRLARAELAAYPDAHLRDLQVVDVSRSGDGFRTRLDDGSSVPSRSVILATGTRDRLPDIPGLQDLYGKGIYPCPYCDAWEYRDQAVAVVGERASGFALKLRRWSRDTIWFSQGARAPDESRARLLRERGIRVVGAAIIRVAASPAGLALILADGEVIQRQAAFLEPEREPHPAFITALGCELEGACIACDSRGATTVPGVFIAGDLRCSAQFAIVAAAEGALAAVAADEYLHQADL